MNFPQTNQSNQRVIEVIRASREVSRRLISSESGLSVPSVTRLVNELVDSGYLKVSEYSRVVGQKHFASRISGIKKTSPANPDVGEYENAGGRERGRPRLKLKVGTMNCVPFGFFKQDCFVEKKRPCQMAGPNRYTCCGRQINDGDVPLNPRSSNQVKPKMTALEPLLFPSERSRCRP